MGYLDSFGGGLGGGLLSNAYIDPWTAGFSGASQALLPLMGATRLPSGGIGAALAAAGSGFGQGMTAARQENLKMTPLLIQQLRYNDILKRNPAWLGQSAQGQPQQPAAAPPADPSALDTQANEPPPPANLGDMSAGSGAFPGITAAPQMPAPPPTNTAPAAPPSGIPGLDLLDPRAVSDFLFVYPEMKDYLGKQFEAMYGPKRGGSWGTGPDGKFQFFPNAVAGVSTENAPAGSLAYQDRVRGFEQQKARDAQGAHAEVDPMVTYDKQGNQIIVPRIALRGGNGGPAAGANPPPVRTLPPAAAGAPRPAATTAAAPGQPAPQTAVTDVTKATLNDVMRGVDIPEPPALPAGAFRGTPNAGQVEIQKKDADRLEAYSKDAAVGPGIRLGVHQLLGTMQRGLNTSNIAPLWADLGNAAQGLGLQDLIPKNHDPNDSALFNKVATQLVFNAVAKLGGQIKVAEITGLTKANTNLGMPIATNIDILHTALANQDQNDAKAKLASQFATKHPGVPLQVFDSAFNEKYPLVDTYEKVAAAARQQGWKFPGDKGAGEGGVPGAGGPKISQANELKATQLRANYNALSPADKAAQRGSFLKQLNDLGYD